MEQKRTGAPGAACVALAGILWGALFLGEPIGWHTLAGSVAVLAGTALVTGFSPRQLRAAKTPR